MAEGIPWPFRVSWHGLAVAEKALLMREYLSAAGMEIPFRFDLPDAIGPSAQQTFLAFDQLSTDTKLAVRKLFEADMRAKGLWVPNITEGGRFAWLRNPALSTEKAVLCASAMLQEEAKGPLRVKDLRTFLTERVGRPISNPAGEIKDLSLHSPPLVEYLSRSKGRAGISYKVTSEGASMAKDLHEEFANDEDDSGSDT